MTRYPLEPDAEEMRRLIDGAARRIIEHIESLPSQPASNVEGATEFARSLIEPLPQRGEAYEKLLDFLFRDAIPRSFNRRCTSRRLSARVSSGVSAPRSKSISPIR